MSAISASDAPPLEAGTRPRVFDVRVATTVEEVEEAWATLEGKGGASAYQSRRFLKPWIAHMAPALGVAPRIGLALDASGRPAALLPFGLTKRGLLRAAVFLGGRDANLNLPLVDPALSVSRAEAAALLKLYAARVSPRPDVLILLNQPAAWGGRPNPFTPPHASPSPSAAYQGTLGTDAQAFLDARTSRAARKKLKAKAAKLAEIGAIDMRRACGVDERRDVLHALLDQKQRRFAAKGIDAGLHRPHARAFYEALIAGDPAAFDLYALRVDGRVAAAYAGLPNGRHWHGLINAFDDQVAIARCSPGELLLRHVVADLGARGITGFDLGIGEARYKDALCDETVALADAILPLTVRGRAFAAGETLRLAAKRRIKQTPWAFAALRKIQAARPASRREGTGEAVAGD